MFTSFKDKLQYVHNNLTTSFRGLTVADPVLLNSPHIHSVDVNAGADLLHKYQMQWQEMHKQAEDNASEAQKVDGRITKLHMVVIKQHQVLTQLGSSLARLPNLCDKTEEIISQIDSLQRLVEAVEETLVELADTGEKKELQERELESRFQLAINSEKRLAQLEALREKLSEEHRQKIMKYEKEFGEKQKERQEAFGKAFEDDLETYKQTGSVPTIRPPMTSGPSLEEVELDIDTKALDQMLEE